MAGAMERSLGLPEVSVRVLGPLEVVVDGDDLALGGQRQRAVLALLAARHPEVVGVDVLIEEIWRQQSAERGPGNIQVYVSNLRRALRATSGRAGIETKAPGYRLLADAGEIDWHVFDDQTSAGLAALADGALERARTHLAGALALWRGDFLADLDELELAPHLKAYLDERRMVALEARIEATIGLDAAAGASAELEALVLQHPLRENLWRLLMLALDRAGRRTDALRTFQRARAILREEAGLDPGPLLRETEHLLLHAGADSGLGRVDHGAQLVCLDERRGLVAFELDTAAAKHFLIGRDKDCAVAIPWDRRVSRVHAEVRHYDSDWQLVDLQSTNGTSVNGVKVTEATPVRAGTVIQVGSTQLAFRSAGSELSWIEPGDASTELG